MKRLHQLLPENKIRSGRGKPNQRKVNSWIFRRGIPEQKWDMWIVLVFLRKNRERKFSPKFFWPKFFWTPWGHGRPRLRVMDVRTEMLVFFQDFESLTEVSAPGRPPGYPCGRLPDIRPQNLLFGAAFPFLIETPEFTEKWAKFTNFSFWPFLFFDLACRGDSWKNKMVKCNPRSSNGAESITPQDTSRPEGPRSSKTKTLQMVTLQVKIYLLFFVLGKFGAGGKQEHGRELCADFLWIFTRAQFSLAVLPFEVF